MKTKEDSLEDRQLPYNGILKYPDCIINNTDPTKEDKDQFNQFLKEGVLLRNKTLNQSTSEENQPQKKIPYLLPKIISNHNKVQSQHLHQMY